jgi:hypothetical protein
VAKSVRSPNRLLASLPSADFELLGPHLEFIELVHGTVLFEAGDAIKRVYFHSSMVTVTTTAAATTTTAAAAASNCPSSGAASNCPHGGTGAIHLRQGCRAPAR